MSLQLVRYLALDRCFQSRNRVHSVYELAEACVDAMEAYNPDAKKLSITERQIKNDINFMKRPESGYDIGEMLEEKTYSELSDEKKMFVKDWHLNQDSIAFNSKKANRKKYFYYKDPNFSIGKKPLTSADAARIQEAILTLKRFKGLPQFDWVEEVAARLNKFMNKHEVASTALIFDSSPYGDAVKWIEPLYQAVVAQTPLMITYQPFDKDPQIHHVSPYVVKEFNKRWFVLCHTDQLSYLINLALDRITHIGEGSHPYVPYPGKHGPESFYKDIIGVINYQDKAVEEISLLVEKSLLPYIKTKPIHSSQKIALVEKGAKWYPVSVTLKPNYEFYALILSHGDGIRLVSPVSVRNELSLKVKKMHRNYKI